MNSNFSFSKIILASKSPRRSQLLEAGGFAFEVRTREVEETYPPETPVDEVAEFLARKKAHACKDFLDADDEVLLAADCVVVHENTIYGKPRDYNDAFRILKNLSGNEHRVITGVCLLSKNKEKTFSGVSKVFFAPLSDEEIDYYIREYQPYDKAGAYAIQEWIGWCKILRIDGTYSNIMGLPMSLVYQELSKW